VQILDDAFQHLAPLIPIQWHAIRGNSQILTGFDLDFQADGFQQFRHRHRAEIRHLGQAGSAGERVAQHGIAQPGILRAQVGNVVHQIRVALQQCMQFGFRRQFHLKPHFIYCY